MQWLAALCVKRPVFAWVLVLSLTVVGLFAFGQLGVDRFPNIDVPTISVTTRLPGAAPEQIETEVTDKIEEAVITMAVTADKPVRDITEFADRVLRRRLESSDGVGQVVVIGGRQRQINLWLDPALLRAQKLSVNDVARALQTQNADVPGGRLDQGAQSVTLRTRGRIETIEGFGEVVLREVDGHPVRLRDVA